MIIRVSVALALLNIWISIASTHSQARNPLQYLEILEDVRIIAPKGRVSAWSDFDIELALHDRQRLKLRLEPNHDVLGDGATITYVRPDGSIKQSEVIVRAEHKVFKGTTSLQNVDSSWTRVGWARITVRRDGILPLFEGAFSVNHDNHHIQLSSSYMRTKHVLDPDLEMEDDESMVVWRDSDVSRHSHMDLKRDIFTPQCNSHQLEFNTRLDHPVYQGVISRETGQWGTMSISSILGKRQTDTQTSGNTAGVNLTNSIGQSVGCPSTRRVALVGVATDCTYTGNFNSTQTARLNVITVMNAASNAWESTFNISLGLQNLTIMDADCPGTSQAATPWNRDCDSGLDINDRLNLFSGWRGTLSDTNSHWTLMTKCATGSAVGLAWLGQSCVREAITANTSTGGTETVSGANIVALTSTEWQVVAHETGHTFGAVHDCTNSTCSDGTSVASQQCCPHSNSVCSLSSSSDQLYIMNPYTTSGISTFSACSVGNICSAIGRNSVNTTCLSTNKDIPTISGAQCGNGIVEEGEDCDCGGTAGCGDDACCNPTTCKFVNGAICDDANDDCCTQCQFTSAGALCRSSTGICDPAEYCTGNSSTCPANALAPDGQKCTVSNATETGLACAAGQCTSRNLQCQTVMSGYFSEATANETFACDQETCLLSCASPAFGAGVCYSLQQNLLDGTPCGGDGACYNGRCKGETVGGQVKSWIDDHKTLVIGIAVGVGLLVLATLIACCTACSRRIRGRRAGKPVPRPYGNQAQMQQQMPRPHPNPQGYGWQSQVSPMQQQPPPYQPVSQPQNQGFYAASSPRPQNNYQAQNVLYGAGIIGTRAEAAPGAPAVPPNARGAVRIPPAYPPPLPDVAWHGAGGDSAVRYA